MVRTTLLSLFIYLMRMLITFETFLLENSDIVFNYVLYDVLKFPLLLKIFLYEVT